MLFRSPTVSRLRRPAMESRIGFLVIVRSPHAQHMEDAVSSSSGGEEERIMPVESVVLNNDI